MSTVKGKFVSAFQSMQMLGDYYANDLADDSSKKGSELTNNKTSVTDIQDFRSPSPNVFEEIHNGDELYNPLEEVDHQNNIQTIDMEIVSDNENIDCSQDDDNSCLNLNNNKERSGTEILKNESFFQEEDDGSLSDINYQSSPEQTLSEKKPFPSFKKVPKVELFNRSNDIIDDNDELLGTALAELEEEEREEKEKLAKKKMLEDQKRIDKQKKKKKNKEKLQKAKDKKKKKKKKRKYKNKKASSDEEKRKRKKEKKKEKLLKEQNLINALANSSSKVNIEKRGLPLETSTQAKSITKEEIKYKKKEKDSKSNLDMRKDPKYSSQRKSSDFKDRESSDFRQQESNESFKKRSNIDDYIEPNRKRYTNDFVEINHKRSTDDYIEPNRKKFVDDFIEPNHKRSIDDNIETSRKRYTEDFGEPNLKKSTDDYVELNRKRSRKDSGDRQVLYKDSDDRKVLYKDFDNRKVLYKDSDDRRVMYKDSDDRRGTTNKYFESKKDNLQLHFTKNNDKNYDDQKHKRTNYEIVLPDKSYSIPEKNYKNSSLDKSKLISPLEPSRNKVYKSSKVYESKQKSESDSSQESDSENTKIIPQRISFLENYSKELSKYRTQHSADLNNSQREISGKHNLSVNNSRGNRKSSSSTAEDNLAESQSSKDEDQTNVSKSTRFDFKNSLSQINRKDTLPTEIISKVVSPALVSPIDKIVSPPVKNVLPPVKNDSPPPKNEESIYSPSSILNTETVDILQDNLSPIDSVESDDLFSDANEPSSSEKNDFLFSNNRNNEHIKPETDKYDEENNDKKGGLLKLHDYQKRKLSEKCQELSSSRASSGASSTSAATSPEQNLPSSSKENINSTKDSKNDTVESSNVKSIIPLLTDNDSDEHKYKKSCSLSDDNDDGVASNSDGNSPYNPEIASPIDISSPPSPSAAAIEDERGVDFASYKEVIAFQDIMKSKVKHEARKHKKRKLDEIKGHSENMGSSKPKLVDYLLRQAKVEEQMKGVLKAYFKNREITKEEYKNILKKAVPQVTMSDSPIIPEKIQSLMTKFVRKCKGQRLKEDKNRQKQRKEFAEQQRQLELQIETSNAVINSFQQIRVLPNLPMPPVINFKIKEDI